MHFRFRNIATLFLVIYILTFSESYGQITGPLPSPQQSIKENSVSVLAAFGDTLWTGPGLNRNIDNSADWFFPSGADSVTQGNARVFSLSISRDTVLAGLGFNLETSDGSVQTASGYHFSFDGGNTWGYTSPPLEQDNDTTFIYGGETYSKLPITVLQQSPPFEMDHSGDVILSANWALGIVRSLDAGQSWQRLILPPQSAESLVPEEVYEFNSDAGNRYDPRFDQNLLGFGILIDHENQVWAGTAGGLNISDNALTAPINQVRWKHLQVAEQSGSNSLLGNWIIDIKQQPASGDIWMTNWASGLQPGEEFGIVRTSDLGESFEQYLVGQRINDLGFKDSYIFAAGDNGLFISPDNGNSWRHIRNIQSPNTFIKESAQYLSVAATSNRVWVGTSDGLASTDDFGESWQITRVNFPLKGGNQYQVNTPDVEAYAYPSPYSPSQHGIVRIKFEVVQSGDVKVRLFDFGSPAFRFRYEPYKRAGEPEPGSGHLRSRLGRSGYAGRPGGQRTGVIPNRNGGANRTR